MSKILFDKIYDYEMLYDLPEDIGNALDETYNKKIAKLPADEYGYIQGTFHVVVTWEPEEHTEKE